ncbi:hypothetical protein GCM10011490_14540 [Pseudoclavibacter endophyticus]|uniref:Transglutaminase family protein n=1 Tax=Pseudoclavibacter endophyticus TaxID=1778590 RepID=A0A6H9WS59_9MICO|nr:transglutaminase family protein [Pseudoclavibacter endophyticus]KAB1649154.1 transglutaminase family protein [Pseudoclavibacter endophyticus]GGA65007.1 hypothetical protein GCM10011490_14540 [Pseudoclavibacter endophyticus]
MTIRVALQHRTTYTFAEPVKVFPHTVRLRPAAHSRTPVESYSLTVSPHDHFVNWQQDPFGNWMARLVFPGPVKELEITVDLVADMTVINPFDFFVEDDAERYPFAYADDLRESLAPYFAGVESELVDEWIGKNVPVPAEGVGIIDFLVSLNRSVRADVEYTVRMEPGVQSPDETISRAIGSCRDSAWLLVAVLRRLGLAARFVSGYLVQLASDVESLDGPSGPAGDFTDLHAWAEVFLPGAGWVGLDATSGLFAGEGHIPLSCTPRPSAAAPISGATAPVSVEFDFSNDVVRIHEDPRVTKPYSDEAWRRVDALGRHIDGLLEAGDVRLTMGGEPTFVSLDDATTPQWNSAADGPEKRTLARDLADRLRRRFADGGLVHHGQGKWYPGEPLPRWQIELMWRRDGEPIWQDPSLLASPWSDPAVEPDSDDAHRAVKQLAIAIGRAMGIDSSFVHPAYEDALYDARAEAMLPRGERPRDDLGPEDNFPERRAAVVTEIDRRDRGMPAAWVLPIFRMPDDEERDEPAGTGWGTARWRPRRRALFLTPGESPAGYRLPLTSIAWTEGPEVGEREITDGMGSIPLIADALPPAAELEIEDAPRHALVAEERDGHLFVFLPPIGELEHGLQLVHAVELAAAAIGRAVVIEGYRLPGDDRVTTMSVTPDPGVIEVNTPPTGSWPELCDVTFGLYDDARRSRLVTEKFDLDGTHTGTGGGNHFTLGSWKPADSPLLRRPDLLRSLITYWQHHPALSYLFSGRFIGPTSQAPRVDEGRPETLYELEIAFAELDRVEPASFTQVDRLLRNLLTDVTGNTHRAEFCIDKLYAPGPARGRLGLLELRAFEMPPHARMALVQALLIRALVAMFWAKPYRHDLVRWRTGLHDRFLLPDAVADDLRDVLDHVNDYLATTATELRFEPAWFDAFLEFRFPRLGEATIAGVALELRSGVEPWHVLGEEATRSGTSRYVDSSVERVQVKATGLVDGRHRILCNGVPVPMRELGPGTAIGGVRYRAWAPPSSLHPTMGVHSPLVFDLVDTWNGRSLGGFTYHVVHPGGRSYERPPVNAAEAEARRSNRFTRTGMTGGRLEGAVPEGTGMLAHDDEFPLTLDLRKHLPGNPPAGSDAGPSDEAGGVFGSATDQAGETSDRQELRLG